MRTLLRGSAALVLAAVFTSVPALAQHSMRPPAIMYHYPRWSPDERSIVTVGMTTSGSEVVIFPDTGGTPVRIAIPGLEVTAADWTSDGRLRVTHMEGGQTPRTFVMDRDGRNRRELPRDSITSASPDSSVLLFEKVVGRFSTVFATDSRRSRALPLTRDFWAEQASFSRDGRRLVFERRFEPDRIDLSEIVLMDPDGRNAIVIARGTDPSWSPGDSLILFKSMAADGTLSVAVVGPATKAVRLLAKGVHPQWSPSGRRVVYMVDRPDHSVDIYTVRLDGGSPRCITCASSG